MADSNSDSSNAPNPINAIMALLTLVGGLYLVSSKLSSDRPVMTGSESQDFIGWQELETRLWEDPFSAERQKLSLRGTNRLAVGENRLEVLKAQIHEVEELKSKVVLMPVMVSGGDYSEDRESRIRNRYAVVSALGTSGYVADDAEHIGAVRIPWPDENNLDQSLMDCKATNADGWFKMLEQLPGKIKLDLRYEWFDPRDYYPGSRNPQKGGKTSVLVLWLNDSFFEDHPLIRITYLLHELEQTNGADVRLLGPQRSSTLFEMLPAGGAGSDGTRFTVETNCSIVDASKPLLKQVRVFSAGPSAMDEVLVTNEVLIKKWRRAPRGAVREALTNIGFTDFHNFAATDSQMADEILRELELRDASLKELDNHLVLISEWDTFYARMIGLTYLAKLAVLQQFTNNVRDYINYYQSTPNPWTATNFHPIVYLRGLDGQTVSNDYSAVVNNVVNSGSGSSASPSIQDLRKWVPDANKAEGQAQFDYLSRVGVQLQNLDAQLAREGRGRIKAVGVVGSDVYDTLLILQALRAKFPNAIFFTTDMDARLCHPQELNWSQNLIVASGFGLALHEDLQKDVPPFRDALQTAQYAATMAALGNQDLLAVTNIPPRRFEIGRHGAVDLSVASGLVFYGTNSFSLHPLTRYESHAKDLVREPGSLWKKFLLKCGLLAQPQVKKPDSGWRETLKWYFKRRFSLSATPSAPKARIWWCGFGMIAFLLLLTFFHSPLRKLTWGWRDYRYEILKFSEDDVGGPDGAAALFSHLTALSWEVLAKEPPLKEIRIRLQNKIEKYKPKALKTFVGKPSDTPSVLTDEEKMSALVDALNNSLKESRAKLLKTREQLNTSLKFLAQAGRTSPIEFQCLAASDAARGAAIEIFKWRKRSQTAWAFGLIATSLYAILMAYNIWMDSFETPNGQPLSWTNGTSAWPAQIIRLGAVIASLGFMYCIRVKRKLGLATLKREFRFEDVNLPDPPPGKVSAARLWAELGTRLTRMEVLMRILLPLILYICLCITLFCISGGILPYNPLRGPIEPVVNGPLLAWAIVGYLLLTLITIQAVMRCQEFIQRLTNAPTHYSDATCRHFARTHGEVPEQYLDEWIDVELIGELTARIGSIVYFPFIVYFLLLVARNEWSGNWPWPKFLMLIFLLNLVIAAASMVMLRRTALNAKHVALENLNAKIKLLRRATAATKEEADKDQAQRLLDEIKNNQTGAFAKFWNSPVFGAVLLPSSGLTVFQLLIWILGR